MDGGLTMPEAKLPKGKNAYRFRGNAIDVIAELPKQAASAIRRGGYVTVTVEWSEPADPVRCPKCGGPHPFHDPACVVHPDLIQDHTNRSTT